jgi:hypothetical protein
MCCTLIRSFLSAFANILSVSRWSEFPDRGPIFVSVIYFVLLLSSWWAGVYLGTFRTSSNVIMLLGFVSLYSVSATLKAVFVLTAILEEKCKNAIQFQLSLEIFYIINHPRPFIQPINTTTKETLSKQSKHYKLTET